MTAVMLRIEPEELLVDPGQSATFTIHLVNQSGVVERVGLDVLGSAGSWSHIEPPAVALFPGSEATATVVVTPPPGTPLGPVPIGIRATAETSASVDVVEASLSVGESRSVEAELRPRTATGRRRATSVVVLHNRGNAPANVSVVATDPDDAIVFDLPAAVQIGPGMVAELPLRMRLLSREKQGATRPYQVIVGGDTGQSLDGQVRQPPRPRWPVLAAVAVLGLLALAFLLFKPQDAVAIKEGSGDEPTTTTVVGATTTSVAGAPTTAVGPTTLDPSKPGVPPPGATTPGSVGGTTVPAPGTVPTGPKPTTLPPVPVPTTQTTQVAPCPAGSSGPAATVARNTSKVVVDTRNVSDPNGDQIVVTGVTPPAHGTAVIDATMRMITYTPARDFIGNDSFVYTVNNGRSDGSASASMAICVR